MKARILVTGSVLALAGWFMFAPASTVEAAHHGYQTPQNEWYQGQRGQWYRDRDDSWRWRGAQGDEWYQGQRGHWYDEGKNSGWQWRGDASERGRWARANAQSGRRHYDVR